MEIFILIGVFVLVYARVINYGLVVDDIRVYRENIKRVFNFKNPISSITSYLIGSGTSKNKRIDHAISLFIHLINCLLLYIVFGSNEISFFASLIFMFHPATTQISCWLNGKRYGVNSIICLLVLKFPLMIGLVFLMPFLQPSGLPILLFLVIKYKILLLVIPVFIYLMRNRIIGKFNYRKKESSKFMSGFKLKKIVVFFKTFGYYVRHCFLPRNSFMWSSFLYYYGMTEKETRKAFRLDIHFFFGLASFILLSTFAVFNITNLSGFGIAWFIIFILMWCNLVTVTQTIADRYCYLPLVGLSIAISDILISNQLYPIMLIYIGYLLCRTDIVIPMYRNLMSFHNHHIHFCPNNPLAFIFKTQTYIANGMMAEAHVTVNEGLKNNPNDFKLLCHKSSCLALEGKFDEAERWIVVANRNLIPGKSLEQLVITNRILLEINNLRKRSTKE